MNELDVDVTDRSIAFGDHFSYEWAARRRPFLHPVRSPAGHVLTVDAPDDHPWHHALWFAIKFVNGENFWEEYDEYGVVRHREPPRVGTDAGGQPFLDGTLDWIRPDRSTVVVRESRRIGLATTVDPDAYAIDFATTLVPEVDVVLDRTPFTTWGGYGGLTFRGRPDFHDTRLLLGGAGPIERALGQRGPWLDLSGYVGGEGGDASAGVTIVSRSSNPGHPPPWYASTRADTYGDDGWSNFVNAAFLWDGPITLAAGEAFTLEYRVVVHDGIWDAEQVEAEVERYEG